MNMMKGTYHSRRRVAFSMVHVPFLLFWPTCSVKFASAPSARASVCEVSAGVYAEAVDGDKSASTTKCTIVKNEGMLLVSLNMTLEKQAISH